jgi:hypothetical protein
MLCCSRCSLAIRDENVGNRVRENPMDAAACRQLTRACMFAVCVTALYKTLAHVIADARVVSMA